MPCRFPKLAAALVAVGLVLSSMASMAQAPRGTPFVSILGEDRAWRSYETNAIPLLFNRVRFGWRLHLGGPDRTVALVETMTTSQPMAQVTAGPGVEVNPEKTRVVVRMRLSVQNGYLQRAQGIIPGDPPGTYTYSISIDGEPRGEFVFCAIEVPDQNPGTDPRTLHCPNKFNAVEWLPPTPSPTAL